MSLEINEQELKNKNFEELAELTCRMHDDARKFLDVTKAKLIVLMAEALKKAQFPILEIRGAIQERLGDRVTTPYLLSCLPDEYKNPKSIAKGKAGAEARKQKKAALAAGAGNGQAMEEPELESEQGDVDDSEYLDKKNNDPNYIPALESESDDMKENRAIAQDSSYTDGDLAQKYNQIMMENIELTNKNQELEATVTKIKGGLPYHDNLSYHKVLKIDKILSNDFNKAIDSSKNFAVLIRDDRTSNIVKVYSDKEWKTQTVYPKKE